ncbi:uncharacterized protein B0I36DRAFT_331157 [Microdochium trichocladiopsis]|uniref:NADAR domain-containing protein n=1 Tax=Microdochium trichocladiopsis TaxID=1682393 RepID=A0A9P8Y3W4_9PEZI|nr:uncharacterized protein B0I36DRAFT_331157 [Microdochium trichocladiopsis]KAH7026693.1 hypothetical protein B0I36DRAFT_331157 [Microdochium trichocladiopsis]
MNLRAFARHPDTLLRTLPHNLPCITGTHHSSITQSPTSTIISIASSVRTQQAYTHTSSNQTSPMPAKRSNNHRGAAPPRAKAKKIKTAPTTTTTTDEGTSKNPDKGIVYFWKPTHPQTGYLSQWYWLPFYDDQESPRKVYKTAEHYMMHHKALLFGDPEIAAEILEANDPKLVKRLGRAVRGFDDKTWNENREKIVTRGSYCKFSFPITGDQETEAGRKDDDGGEDVAVKDKEATADNNQEAPTESQSTEPREWELGNAEDALLIKAASFRDVLLQTGNKELVEASPMDRIWGVGFGAANAGANRGRWGLNLLGKCLMKAREQFLEEGKNVN